MTDVTEIAERREQAEEAVKERDRFASRVSILVAMLAVITAITASLEVTESGGAITDASRAVLAQDKATDAWSAYQSASLKKHLYDIAGAGVVAGRADLAADYAKDSEKYTADQKGYQATAKAQEKASEAWTEESERHEARHHRLTLAAALMEIGIAISTIAIITRRHWPWIGSVILGIGGLVVGATAFL